MWLVCATILSVVPLGIFRKVETHQAFSFLHLSRPQTDVSQGGLEPGFSILSILLHQSQGIDEALS